MKRTFSTVKRDEDRIEIIELLSQTSLEINEENTGRYYNRRLRAKEGMRGLAYLVDGYSSWAQGNTEIERQTEEFTIDVWILPRSFEEKCSGILSCFDEQKKEGYALGVGKFGRIYWEAGIGDAWIVADSKTSYVRIGHWNHVVATFDGSAGWLSIFLNGELAGRQQFPRHSTLKIGTHDIVLGKRNNGCSLGDIFEFQVFDGYIDELIVEDKLLKEQDVRERYLEDCEPFGGRPKKEKQEDIMLDPLDYGEDRNRPRYHMIAPGHWMNEPHAPIYFKGYYHLFYQANPHAPVWNHIQWGHVVSKDMVHWKHLELALPIENNQLDPDGCWSGSSCLDKTGIPMLLYTAGNNNMFPNQAVALAKSSYANDGDLQLKHWIKEEKAILCQGPNMGWRGEFRDPFIWREGDTYFLLVGTGDENNGGGNAVLFSSFDMKEWKHHGFITEYPYEKCTEVGHVWELPVFLPLKNQNGDIQKWILLFCACQIENEVVEVYYLTGTWNAQKAEFVRDIELPQLLDYGKGTFTGPSGFVTEDGRTVIFTIAQGKRTLKEEIDSGWAHNGGLPIELFLHDNGQIGIRPICELKSLREKKVIEIKQKSVEDTNIELKDIAMDQMEFHATLEFEQGLLFTYGNKSMEFSFFKEENCYKMMEAGKAVGRKIPFRKELDGISSGDTYSLHGFIDGSMLELYINETDSFTYRNYLPDAKNGNRSIRIIGEEKQTVKELNVWKLGGIF